VTSLSDRLKANRGVEVDQTPLPPTPTATAPRDERKPAGASASVSTAQRPPLQQADAGNSALVKLKERATAALFERLGGRLNDPSLSESQLHALVRSDLNHVVEEE